MVENHSMQINLMRRLHRLGILALVVVLLGQAGLLAHNVTVDHSGDTACQLCPQFDRLAAAPAMPGGGVFAIAAIILLPVLAIRVGPSRTVYTHPVRGPPAT